MRLPVDAHGPIPARSQLTDQLKHVIEGGGVPRDQAGLGSWRWPVASRQQSESGGARHRGSQAERIPAAPPLPRGALSPRPSRGRPPSTGATR
jgi:hypothetical protein